jgi:hypothetical protein
MIKKPFSKLTGYLAAITVYVAGMGFDTLKDTLDNYIPIVVADPLAHFLFGLCVIVGLLSHAVNGTGGSTAPNADKSLTSNLTRR